MKAKSPSTSKREFEVDRIGHYSIMELGYNGADPWYVYGPHVGVWFSTLSKAREHAEWAEETWFPLEHNLNSLLEV